MILTTDMLVVVAAPFIGSFLATLAHRLPAGEPIALARSACPGCGEVLPASSLVPVISWVAQLGRCRHCHGRISPAYPLVEIAALAIAVWSVWTVGAATGAAGWIAAASCALGWTLLALSLIDARHFILPDVLTLPLAAAGLMVTFAIDPSQLAAHLAAAAAGFAALALVNSLYRRIRGRDGLGLGDAKLLAAGGAWVGPGGLVGIVLIASFAALAWALADSARRQQLSWRTRIAFGPFLALGIWIIWLYGPLEFSWTT